MWIFTTVYHELRMNLGISYMEYVYLDYIAHAQAEPYNKGACRESLEAIGLKIGTSKRHVLRMNENLVRLGLLEIIANQKTATQVWFDGLKICKGDKMSPIQTVTKSPQNGDKMSPPKVTKSPRHNKDISNIIDNIVIEEEKESSTEPTPQQIDIAELNTQKAKAELIETLQAHSGSVFHEMIRAARINAKLKHKAWQWVLFELDKCINYYIGKDEQTRIGQKRALKATLQNWLIRAGQTGYDSFEYKPEVQPKLIEAKPDIIVKTRPYAKANRP